MRATSASIRRRERLTQEKRDQIVLDHIPLVKSIAIRVHENLPVHVDLDDLINAGVLGLFDAVKKYDGDKKVVFHAYAKHRIKGAILDSLRDMDWATRELRRQQRELENVTRNLTTRLGRPPEQDEVAAEMGLNETELDQVHVDLRAVTLMPSAPQTDDERERSIEFVSGPEFSPDFISERRELKSTIQRAVKTLPERYQKVVFMYYTNDMTMKEIGDLMGVNESRISQIHKIALKKMATVLEGQGINRPMALAS